MGHRNLSRCKRVVTEISKPLEPNKFIIKNSHVQGVHVISIIMHASDRDKTNEAHTQTIKIIQEKTYMQKRRHIQKRAHMQTRGYLAGNAHVFITLRPVRRLDTSA